MRVLPVGAQRGLVLGAVHLPPDGLPIVLLADHPTTGGYPVVVWWSRLIFLPQPRPGRASH
jgi:allophanate hydrolase subunit 2